jgi:hypothetical protein
MARVDSTTLLGLVGIAGTLLGTAIGARGATSAARVTSRGQAEVEEHQRATVARAVGAVVVEGPYQVAAGAEAL